MNPVFTLNYPELLVAEYLKQHFTQQAGHSVLIPLSAQQKGFDISLMRRNLSGSKVVTFQVKSSRTYVGVPGITPRTGMRTFSHEMWLKRFTVPPEADFFVLIGQYAASPTSQKITVGLWKSHLLLFTHQEMTTFILNVRQKKQNMPDTHFGFGFDKPSEAFWTRGHVQPKHPDYSSYLLANRLGLIKAAL